MISLSFVLQDIEAVLGKPDQVVKRFIKYIYDNIGIMEHSFTIKKII